MGMPRNPMDSRFYEYLDQGSQAICDSARILKDFIDSGRDPADQLEQLESIEQKGERMFTLLQDQLNLTPDAPFEREDVSVLGRELAGMIEYIHQILELMVKYHTQSPDPSIITLVELLERAAGEIRSAVLGLASLQTNYEQVLEACDKIRNYEQQGDFLFRTGVALLFENFDNAIEIGRWQKVLEHLQAALEHCEQVSNVLIGVATKYA
ncbi:MAG: DUF47 domain-containing protein [Solirubrobacterales bacterium]